MINSEICYLVILSIVAGFVLISKVNILLTNLLTSLEIKLFLEKSKDKVKLKNVCLVYVHIASAMLAALRVLKSQEITAEELSRLK